MRNTTSRLIVLMSLLTFCVLTMFVNIACAETLSLASFSWSFSILSKQQIRGTLGFDSDVFKFSPSYYEESIVIVLSTGSYVHLATPLDRGSWCRSRRFVSSDE